MAAEIRNSHAARSGIGLLVVRLLIEVMAGRCRFVPGANYVACVPNFSCAPKTGLS